ncbi:MAG: GxxExxY protein [Planctomycetes bacterium]|nr:GxxExxY protein [Planctomycetota bacterium]
MAGAEFCGISKRVIGCAIEVHKMLGPGLLESTYQQCLAHELRLNDINFELEKPLPVVYKGIKLDCGYRIDLLIENELVVELKSVEFVKPVHESQILSYMKLAEIKHGLLINFNVKYLKEGLKSFIM